MSAPLRLPPLYPIVDVRGSSAADRSRALDLAVELARAGADLLQLRAKTQASGDLAGLATAMRERLQPLGCRLIVNDRADIALVAGAAGVHVGDEDLPPSAARRILPEGAIVGYSTHSLAEVEEAAGLPVDYLGFGPVFESPTKPGARRPRGVDALAAVCRAARQPVVAIGGVTLASAPALWAAGAASVAVIGEIESAEDPGALVRAYLAAAGR